MEEEHRSVTKPKPNKGIQIVGYNLLALAAYTLAFKFIDGGMFLDAILLFFHVLISLILAAALKSWVWFLAAVMVLAIGFSTCVTLMSLNLH